MKMIYYSYVHSLLSYGIVFWGNAPHNENIFKIQKRTHITITVSIHFSIILFVVKNRNYFRSNADIHDINTRFNHNSHLPSTNLSIVQRGVLFSGSMIYNHLSSKIKLKSENIKEFKLFLKTYLTEKVLYRLLTQRSGFDSRRYQIF
jgi:hypothetical protein